jgi:two-component system response regulator YesN
MIADDDKVIRLGLSQTIAWEQEGYELVGTAKNGEEALELVAEHRPHILISDICMPFMDGIELTRAVKDQFPETKIILMTGFEEFEYAKEALKLKVFDYLMKPMSNEALVDAAWRATQEIEQENGLKQKVLEALPLLRQRFLESLIRGRLKEGEIEPGLTFLDLPLQASRYCVAIIKADEYGLPHPHNRFGKEMLKYCILNLSEEILQRSGLGIAFDSHENEMVLILRGETVREQFEAHCYEVCEEMRHSAEKFLKTTVTIGLGYVYDECRRIARSYQEARSAIEFRHILGKNKVLTIHDTGAIEQSESADLTETDKDIAFKVKLGLEFEALELLDEIERRLKEQGYRSLSQIRFMLMELIMRMIIELQKGLENKDDLARIEQIYRHYNNRIQVLELVSDMFGEIRRMVSELADFTRHKRASQQKSLVLDAIAYMEENFTQERLSLQDVSSRIHISPTYLSIIFKQERGVNFVDFLLEIRMNKAKQLLIYEDMKVYEIAAKVGFINNPKYFNVCFKKFTGITPIEFRLQYSKSP